MFFYWSLGRYGDRFYSLLVIGREGLGMYFFVEVIFVFLLFRIILFVKIRGDVGFFVMDLGCLVEFGFFFNGEDNCCYWL